MPQRKTNKTRWICSKFLENQERPLTGYDLMTKFGHQLNSGSVYPILRRLELEGWLVSEWGPPQAAAPPRRLYRVASADAATAMEDWVGDPPPESPLKS